MNHPQRLLLPFLAAILAVALLSIMDALMKGASLAAGVYTASLLRSLMAATLVTPVWIAARYPWPQWPVLKLHLERGLVSAVMALTFFYALTKLPLAEAIAISFVAPLLALYLAHLLLGEQIARTAIWASLLGFAGTLVIVGGRLGRSDFDEGTAWGLASLFVSALLYAYNFVLIRRQSQLAPPLEVAVFHSGVSGLAQVFAAPFFFMVPNNEALGLIGLSALLTIAASIIIAWAYARAEAQVLVPVEYTAFLWAAVLGWIYFGEQVTPTTLIGVAVIVIACWIATPKRRKEPALIG